MATEFASLAVRHPPGPLGLPYFGCLNGLLRDPMTFWSDIADRYGGIARVPLMRGHVAYLVSDPTLLYELLVTNRQKYRKNIRYRAAVQMFGAGLLLNEGEAWKRQRLLSQPAFKADYIATQIASMTQQTAEFLDRWGGMGATQQVCDVEGEFLDLSQLLAGNYLLGPGFATIEARFCRAAIAIKNNWPRPPRSILQLLMRRGDGWSEQLAAAARDIDVCIFEYLAQQRRAGFANSGIVQMLVEGSRAQGDEFNDQSLRDQVLTLFFAGHETTATSLSWIHYLLSEHRDVRDKVRAEAQRVLSERQPTLQDLDELRYTEQVVNEALRLYSPIHSLSRVALEQDTIGGYHIPRGATVYVSLYATHRLAQFWPDPHRFDPDRFAPEQDARRPRFSYIPFAAGHRNCIGASTAIVELKLVTAMLAQRYDLDLAPGQRVEPTAGTTMRPRYGMKMRVRAI